MRIDNYPEQKRPLIEAINKFGSTNSFAKAIGVSRQVVSGWLHICKFSPPAKYCKIIEDVTCGEISRAQLRPDLFGEIECEELTDEQKIEGCIAVMKSVFLKLSEQKKGRK